MKRRTMFKTKIILMLAGIIVLSLVSCVPTANINKTKAPVEVDLPTDINPDTFITIIADAHVVVGIGEKIEPFGKVKFVNSQFRSMNVVHFDATATEFENCFFDKVYPDNAKSLRGSLVILYEETDYFETPEDNANTTTIYIGPGVRQELYANE